MHDDSICDDFVHVSAQDAECAWCVFFGDPVAAPHRVRCRFESCEQEKHCGGLQSAGAGLELHLRIERVCIQMQSRDLLMTSLSRFYGDKTNIEKIAPIINGKSEISLRLLDWFVTNYCKKTATVIKHNEAFNVYLSYRSQLKAYSKQQFDPFRRRDRITFFYDNDSSIETTIGQLNFFRWVIQNHILEYITKNIEMIEQDMFSVQKMNQKENASGPGGGGGEAKRSELTKSFVRNMNVFEGRRTMSFT